MIYFIRLIRPFNLFIIALTMYSLRLVHGDYQKDEFDLVREIDYFLLVIATLVIAAAGNIINDYFDVKADQVNKPERLIIDKHIKKRWAIVWHWSLNILAFLIGCYLSIKLKNFAIIFIFLLSINLLWFYSVYFKRRAFIGNFIVALLTSLVIVLCYIYLEIIYHYQAQSFEEAMSQLFFSYFSVYFALYAFIINLAREIIKDIQDKKGDVLIHAKTLPFLIGDTKTKYLASVILLFFPLLSYSIFRQMDFNFTMSFFVIFTNSLIVLSILFLFINRLNLTSILLKIVMLTGISFPFFIWLAGKL